MFTKKYDPIGFSVSEFFLRWSTGKEDVFAVPVAVPKIMGDEDSPTIYDLHPMKLEVCEAPMGEFLRGYVEHLGIPRNSRRSDWSVVEGLYRQELDKIHKIKFPRRG